MIKRIKMLLPAVLAVLLLAGCNVQSANPVGYFRVIFQLPMPSGPCILLTFGRSFQRVPWHINNTFIIVG